MGKVEDSTINLFQHVTVTKYSNVTVFLVPRP